jgi:hypothetical protein
VHYHSTIRRCLILVSAALYYHINKEHNQPFYLPGHLFLTPVTELATLLAAWLWGVVQIEAEKLYLN